jgi:hypothetical protein
LHLFIRPLEIPIIAIALLFASAYLHTLWNLLLKDAGDKYITSWWTVVIEGLAFLPALLCTGLPIREICLCSLSVP